MDIASLINLIVALARVMKVDPKDLALAFNERDKNQKYWMEVIEFQGLLDKKA